MTNPLGSGVSRYINDRDRQFGAVVFQVRKPPLDSEWNLISLIDLEARAEEVRSRVASGWLMDESNPAGSFSTDPTYSNLFFFGRNASGEVRTIEWANVNGWLIPVTGTQTGAPPLQPNDADTWNKILLNPPSASTGGNTADFVFLEVWLATIDVDPASPGVAPGKPQRGFIYRFGNVEGGYTFLADEIVDPDINAPTTRRVQIQYRIRVVSNINIATYPDGFDQTTVFAQGLLSTSSVIPFTNMRQELGDAGLWRAGTGDPSTFGTVDGYVYAIPICSTFRRNSAGFSDTGNLAGAFDRNSTAITRADSTIYVNSIVLPSNILSTDTSFTLTSITGTVLATMSSFGEAYFRINDEIIRITGVIPVGLNYQVNIARGQLQTIVRAHNIGTTLIPYTIRPDGLFADQVTATDILDLRHSIADKFDYENILKTNLSALLKGKLRTSWKRYGSTNSAGPVILYGDRITDASSSVGGLTKLDAPDGLRRIFSDSVTIQRFNVPVTVPSTGASLGNQIQTTVSPYDGIEVVWTAAAPGHSAGVTRLYTSLFPAWWNGDQIQIPILPFAAGMPVSDLDQVRFMLPSEDIDAVIVRFEGMTSDPNGGNPSSTPPTIPSATHPALSVSPSGQAILKNGHGITVTIDGSGNLLITLSSGTAGIPFQEFLDALQGNTGTPYATRLKMHVEFTVVYGAGRGLSHKPEFIHSVQYNGSPANTSKTIRRDGLSLLTRMIPTYFGDSPYIQVGNDRTLTRTSEVMIDPGSKTAVVAPYRNVQIPSLLSRNGTQENWYFNPSLSYQGCMPQFAVDGVTSVHSVVDPLGLFYYGVSSLYVEIPMEYLPKPGLHYIPIVPVSTTVFSSGINFLLMSKQGNSILTSDNNPNLVSYPSGAGYYIITPRVTDVPFTTPGPNAIYGNKYTNSQLTAANGGPFRGILFPPFLAPARITGIYLRGGNGGTAGDIHPVLTPFDNSRTYVGNPGSDVNLMRDSFDGPVFLLDVDTNGDLSFILNADVIDFSKAPPGITFDNSNFFVECTLFAFDRGFLQTNGRVLIARTSAGGSIPIAQDVFTNASDDLVGLVTTAPLAAGSSNNEITFYYSRTPYQGDIFGTQNSYSDDAYSRGPLTVGEAYAISTNQLGSVSTLTLPNKTGFEVLAAISFTTSLGTGRFSGSVPTPLLTQFDAPNNPVDFAGTRVDLYRRFSSNRVGFEDWATPKFPVIVDPLAPRPLLKTGALSEVFDNDVHPEFAGCVANLPIGAYFKDKDFIGKTMYQMRSSNGVGSIPIGALAYVPFEASMVKSAEGVSTWEGTEFICGNASGTAGVGSEALIKVDGTSNFNSTTVFKTNRGGAAWSATGPWPGGIISAKFLKARPNTEVGSIMTGTAYLVRSAPESVGMVELHPGHELQMIVVTKAIPTYFRSTDLIHSADGTGEGYTAVDRFRILGHPIEKKRGFVDASASSIPTGKPLFVNDIYDNPLLYGSADIPTFSQKDETLQILTNGQTVFALTFRPVDPTAVTLYLNGNKLVNGIDFTISGPTSTVVTYIPSITNPVLSTTDVLETWYMYF